MPDGCLFFRKNAENLTAEFPVMGALPFYFYAVFEGRKSDFQK